MHQRTWLLKWNKVFSYNILLICFSVKLMHPSGQNKTFIPEKYKCLIIIQNSFKTVWILVTYDDFSRNAFIQALNGYLQLNICHQGATALFSIRMPDLFPPWRKSSKFLSEFWFISKGFNKSFKIPGASLGSWVLYNLL